MEANKKIQSRLESALEKYGYSQNRAAKEIGYSASAISDYRNDKYSADLAKLEEAIERWLTRMDQFYSSTAVGVVQTQGLNRIMMAISVAHIERDIALITGKAGSSKSTAAQTYWSENPRTCIYIEVVQGMNRKAMIQAIAGSLGIDTYRVGEQSLIRLISEMLHDRQMVVILDEADYLKADALEFSRRLVHDLGQSGLVLIGLPRLAAKIQNLRNDHRQLESRIGIHLQVPSLSRSDARQIARSVWPNITDAAFTALYKHAHGDVRVFTKLMSRIKRTMARNNTQDLDVEMVDAAAETAYKGSALNA